MVVFSKLLPASASRQILNCYRIGVSKSSVAELIVQCAPLDVLISDTSDVAIVNPRGTPLRHPTWISTSSSGLLRRARHGGVPDLFAMHDGGEAAYNGNIWHWLRIFLTQSGGPILLIPAISFTQFSRWILVNHTGVIAIGKWSARPANLTFCIPGCVGTGLEQYRCTCKE